MKQHLKTVLCKPLCHRGFKVSCAVYHVYRVECGCWPSLCHCSPPSLDPVCSTLCSNCHNCLLARHVILHDFLWHVQCVVHGSRALGWFNLLFFEPVRTSPHPAIWLGKVGWHSSQSEPWVDATCSLEIEHPGRAENQGLANHRCSAEHVLLHALVKYTIQLAYSTRSLTPSITVYFGPKASTSKVGGKRLTPLLFLCKSWKLGSKLTL